jgi:Spy/CpxP family protein refolding chaperone
MITRTVLAGILGLTLVAPVAAAQGAAAPQGTQHPRLERVARNFRQRVQRGVRTGRITQDERSQLRSEMQALRDKVRAMREAGTPPSPEQRQALRQDVRKVNRDIFRANHGTPPGGGQ